MEDPRRTVLNLIDLGGWTVQDVWVMYWSQGGEAEQFEFDAYLHGAYELAPFDMKILAWALEEITA